MAKSILDENDYAASIRQMRKSVLGMTQQQLADALGVAFPTVNRWENGKAKPSRLIWEKLVELEAASSRTSFQDAAEEAKNTLPVMGFASTSQKVRAAIEAERLAYAHSVNPAFATEISRIDPLPHQRIAVYDHMLKQDPLRFLLADDAGAGKTIMCGLYIREMLARKRIRRIIIIPPAGLVGNWRNELSSLFQLDATIVSGTMIRNEGVNPFAAHDFVICSIDKDEITVSARSKGRINVQIIMEQLHGGGHMTAAGMQAKDVSTAKMEADLMKVLDEYFKGEENESNTVD